MMIEMPGHQRDIQIACLTDRFAIVEGLQHSKQASMALHHTCQRIKMPRPCLAAHSSPGCLRLCRRLDGIVQILNRSERRIGQFIAGRRFDRDKRSSLFGGHKASIDEMAESPVMTGKPGAHIAVGFGRRTVIKGIKKIGNSHFSCPVLKPSDGG